jgi:hypothetical protein
MYRLSGPAAEFEYKFRSDLSAIVDALR